MYSGFLVVFTTFLYLATTKKPQFFTALRAEATSQYAPYLHGMDRYAGWVQNVGLPLFSYTNISQVRLRRDKSTLHVF
jgi:hypothetical protein